MAKVNLVNNKVEIRRRRNISSPVNFIVITSFGYTFILDIKNKKSIEKFNALYQEIRGQVWMKEVKRLAYIKAWTRKIKSMPRKMRIVRVLSSVNVVNQSVEVKKSKSNVYSVENLIVSLLPQVKLYHLHKDIGFVTSQIKKIQRDKSISLNTKVEMLDSLYTYRNTLRKSEQVWKMISHQPQRLQIVKVDVDDPNFLQVKGRKRVRRRRIEAIVRVNVGKGVFLKFTVLLDKKNRIKGGDVEKIDFSGLF